jgi:hypothetical protein
LGAAGGAGADRVFGDVAGEHDGAADGAGVALVGLGLGGGGGGFDDEVLDEAGAGVDQGSDRIAEVGVVVGRRQVRGGRRVGGWSGLGREGGGGHGRSRSIFR